MGCTRSQSVYSRRFYRLKQTQRGQVQKKCEKIKKVLDFLKKVCYTLKRDSKGAAGFNTCGAIFIFGDDFNSDPP
jgi:hypothetical protein